MKAIVVGAGLVGTSVARALARAGVEVTVIERGVPGAEASWAAGGILSPQVEAAEVGPFLRLGVRGLQATRTLVTSLAAEGHVVDLLTGGTYDVASNADEVAHLQARISWQQAAGLSATWLDADELAQRLPFLAPHLGGAFFGVEASLDPRQLFECLRASTGAAGARFLVGRIVDGVSHHEVRVHAAQDGHEEVLRADIVVVCAGAWTPQVAGLHIDDAAIHPVKGQMLEVFPSAETPAFDAVVYGRGGYLVPRKDGRVVAGSTMEPSAFDKQLTVGGLARITTMMTGLSPSLASATVRNQWAGIRPGTADGLPLLGRTADGVWVASGHFRNGVLLAAVSGELLRDAIVEGVPLDAAFAPDRFASTTD